MGAIQNCTELDLKSSLKQLRRMAKRSKEGEYTADIFSALTNELRTRINEDLEDRVFFSIDSLLANRFFRISEDEGSPQKGMLVPKHAHELFGIEIANRFKAALA